MNDAPVPSVQFIGGQESYDHLVRFRNCVGAFWAHWLPARPGKTTERLTILTSEISLLVNFCKSDSLDTTESSQLQFMTLVTQITRKRLLAACRPRPGASNEEVARLEQAKKVMLYSWSHFLRLVQPQVMAVCGRTEESQ